MRKIKVLAVLFLFLALCSPSFASVGFQADGKLAGTATDLNVVGSSTAGSSIVMDKSTLKFNLVMSGVANGGSTSITSIAAAIPVTYSIVKLDVGITASWAMTLANGTYNGQILTVQAVAREGAGTVILTPATCTGFTSVTFDSNVDSATFLFVNSTVGWILIGQNALTVTH